MLSRVLLVAALLSNLWLVYFLWKTRTVLEANVQMLKVSSCMMSSEVLLDCLQKFGQ